MYPKNAASPQRIAIGAVVQISDGAVQTSGVSVKVLPQGTTASAGGGTIAYEEGIVHYLPTQAETNYASFIVLAYKTGCIPVSATIVTSASGVAGYAGLDWATINAPTTTQGLSGTTVGTITTYTGNTVQTGDSFTRIGAAGAGLTAVPWNASWDAEVQSEVNDGLVAYNAASTTNITAAAGITVSAIGAGVITAASIAASALDGKGNWNIGKTGYSLTAGTGLGNQTANITGDLIGTVSTLTTYTGNTPQTGDSFALANGANGFGALKSDTAAILIDTGTTLDARIPAALTGAGNMKVDVLAIDGSTNAAANLERGTLGTSLGTVGEASTKTSIVTSSLDPAAATTDQFKGRIVTFDRATTTANLRGQATDITASTAGGVLTVTALTDAPVSGDTFCIS